MNETQRDGAHQARAFCSSIACCCLGVVGLPDAHVVGKRA